MRGRGWLVGFSAQIQIFWAFMYFIKSSFTIYCLPNYRSKHDTLLSSLQHIFFFHSRRQFFNIYSRFFFSFFTPILFFSIPLFGIQITYCRQVLLFFFLWSASRVCLLFTCGLIARKGYTNGQRSFVLFSICCKLFNFFQRVYCKDKVYWNCLKSVKKIGKRELAHNSKNLTPTERSVHLLQQSPIQNVLEISTTVMPISHLPNKQNNWNF